MILQNKFFVSNSFFLFNEKVCYQFTNSCNSQKIIKSFMRFDFDIVCNSDFTLVLFCFLCLPIPYNDFSISRNSLRFFIKFSVFTSYIYKMMPFLFFSFLQYVIDGRYLYFWLSTNKSFINSIFLLNRIKYISPFSFFDDYFYGFLDANFFLHLNISCPPSINFINSVFLRLFFSMFCLPFINKYA